ncbi:MAG TPA: cytochrome ubiquinol oxidase subunit I [Fimbriimonadaceae bacterium]|nr:cytochrome ubiquinol oxidase subunit I [Fimbriimonadaceae bacterium]
MNFPFWDVPLIGGGMLIGIIAIVHVFVAYLAVGGGLYLVLTERKALRTGDTALLESVKRHSRFFVLVTLVFGAVTGVGIWWTIGLVSPSATSSLIHIFVWGWAIEWVFFLLEIVAAFCYYYGWNRLDSKTHQQIGWIYFVGAYMSLVVINGILAFMLTTGSWEPGDSFWKAYFNPSMFPSLLIRTGVCIAMAGVFALITGSSEGEPELRARVTKWAARWILAGMSIVPLAGLWYIASLPPLAREISMGGAPAVTLFAGMSIGLSLLILAAAFFGPFLFPKSFHVTGAFFIATLALSVTGVTEWVREAVRKPWVIYDEMYSNSVRKDEVARNRSGYIDQTKWALLSTEDRADPQKLGERMFRFQCQSCHTINGFNGIKPMVKGWRKDFLDYQLQHLDELKGFMPPFMGNDEERAALVEFLYNLNRPKEETLVFRHP